MKKLSKIKLNSLSEAVWTLKKEEMSTLTGGTGSGSCACVCVGTGRPEGDYPYSSSSNYAS